MNCCFCGKEIEVPGLTNGENDRVLCHNCIKWIFTMLLGKIYDDAHTHPKPKPKQEDPPKEGQNEKDTTGHIG